MHMIDELKDAKRMSKSQSALKVVFTESRIEDSQEPELAVEELIGLATEVLKEEGLVNKSIELTIHFIDEEAMAELNVEYMGGTGATDVLAFPLDDPKDFSDGELLLLGDVLICPKVAQRQATQHPYETEISLLLVHGILHLLGYDHAEQEERQIMENRQKDILAKHGLDKNDAAN
ncbi:MAG: Endoribonuclease YbeY [Acidimicrobiales bacterium AG-410-I20]|nr:MAG: Endoribonuclease YbeY [Acidimicrobiales bacterium AG-410-I20]